MPSHCHTGPITRRRIYMNELRKQPHDLQRSLLVLTACWWAFALCLPTTARGDEDIEHQIARLDAALETTPGDPDLLWRRAELHRIHGDHDQAGRDYDRLEQIAPNYHHVWLGRANLALDANDLSRALSSAETFLEHEPASEPGYATLARVLDYSKRPLEAAQAMLHVIELTTRPLPEHYEACAAYYEQTGGEHRIEAIRILDLGADRLAPLPTLELRAVELTAEIGRPEDALRRLDALQESGIRRDRLLQVRGEILEQSGRLLEAMTSWTDALAYMNALPMNVRSRPITQQEQRELENLLRNAEARLQQEAREAPEPSLPAAEATSDTKVEPIQESPEARSQP